MKTYNLKDQDPYVKEIISLGFGKSHYVVIHIDIDKKKIDVYDGMLGGNDLSLWNKSALATLWYYEFLQQADSNVRPVHCLQTDDSHSSSAFWTIAYDTINNEGRLLRARVPLQLLAHECMQLSKRIRTPVESLLL